MGAVERLNELKSAFDDFYAKEKKRLQNEFLFLQDVFNKRGGAAKIQDTNSEGASKILADSINDYLGKPLGNDTEKK